MSEVDERYQIIIERSQFDKPEAIGFYTAAMAKRIAQNIWRVHTDSSPRRSNITRVSVVDRVANKLLWTQPESNPRRNPIKRLETVKAYNGQFVVVAAEGPHLLKVVAGPFDTRAESDRHKRTLSAQMARTAKKNPKRERMGRLIEIRYERDHGRNKGFYKHTFETDVDVFASEDSIFAKAAR
jgi:hypothetical protein